MKTQIKTKAHFNLSQQARRQVLLTTIICSAFGQAQALPFGEQVQAGNISFERANQTLNMNQTSQRAIVNWQSFSIAANESVRLNQPAQGIALFRVVGNDSSQIYGNLTATGSLFLSNPNGVLFGRGAQVDVGSLVATTMSIGNEDFLAGRYQFNGDTNNSVVNDGIIRTEDGGYIALLGHTVENNGTLQANNGSVMLASAQSAILDFYGDGLVRTKLDGDALSAVIKQTGNITAGGGSVQIATNARTAAINIDGVIQANSLVNRNGVIKLEGGKNARVSLNGTLSTKGETAGSQGGQIEVTGEQVALFKNANLDSSGHAGGGTILVGGDLQGKNADVYNARTTYVDKDAKINVDAIQNGDGGKAIVWADNTTRFYGNISAKGGLLAGNGGFIEISGKENLDFLGKVDLSASNGIGGKFLLDPTNIILNTSTQASPANNPNGTPDIAFGDAANNVPVAGTTTVQIADIVGFSEAFFQATNDITIASTLTMGINNSIRLEAGNNINVNAALTTSGTGNINLRADADNSGVGNLAIAGNITSRQGGMTLSAATITRTAGNISATGAGNGNAGNISITTSGAINLGAATISANGGTASAGNSGRNGGVITINANGFNGTGAISASGSNGSGAGTSGGNAGSVNITSTNGINKGAGAITTSGGNAGTGSGNSGSAGAINLANSISGAITTGALTSRVGVAIGTGSGGTAGSIVVSNTATGNLTTGAINTSGNNNSNGNGGNIQVSSAVGNITTGAISSSGGTVRTGNSGKNAGSVNISSGSNIVVGAITATGSAGLGTNQNGGAGGAVTLTAGAGNTITHNNITTSGGARTGTATGGNGGNINVNGNALLSANTTLTSTLGTGGVSSGNITFGGTINSSGANRTLAINTTAATTLNGAIGNTLALASITTNALGTTAINGGSVTTTGAQTYNDAVTFGAATNLATTNSAITFANSVNANGNALTVAAGSGNITATNAANNFANVAVTSANNVSLRDANAIQLGTSNVTGTYTLQTAGAITQTGALSVGGATNITAGIGNDITLNNAGNNFNSVAIVSGRDVNVTDANALTMNASSVRTLTAQTLSGDLTLGGTITATGTGAGTSINLVAAQNFLNPANNSLTPGAGSRWLVYSSNPANDSRGAGLLAASDFKQYNTAFGGSILGAGDGFIYTLAPQITASLGGSATKTYDGNTSAPITGLIIGQSGTVDGDTVNLSALTSATYDNKNAGSSKTVTSNALSITSQTNGTKQVFGYTLASPTGNGNLGTINQASLNLNAVTDAKQYDANTNSSELVIASGLVLGDTITGLSQSFASKNVLGSNASTLNVNAGFTINDGNGGNNYSLITNSASGTITPLTITGSITANNKTYDGNNTATIANRNLAGVIGSDDVIYTGGSATFNNKNAGTGKTVSATGLSLSGLDAANYTVNDTAVTTADISRADISTITGISANNKVYDATTGVVLNTSAASFVGIIGLDNLNVASANGNFSNANAGTGKTVNIMGISLGGTDAGNYNLVTTTAVTTADISQRAITVTANTGQSKIFGAADPLPFNYTVGGLGLVAGDSLSGQLNRVVGETVGNYAILQGTLSASSNYLLSYFSNNFSILAPQLNSPRNEAGLPDLNAKINGFIQQPLLVVNVGETAAGNNPSQQGAECESEIEKKRVLQNPSLMLNFGLNLPKGVSQDCI